jgi:photosystem II stability/assembly factor-like uncharacterized protein
MQMPRLSSTTAVVATLLTVAAGTQAQEGPARSATPPLGWRFVGPYGNRAIAVVGEPGNPQVVYLGAASGGVWKTENGGVDWKPVFDQAIGPDGRKAAQAIGALAISQSDPGTVWAGTGETFIIRPFYPMGDGVYKTTDGGRNWSPMGLAATGHIARIVIDPKNANNVYVCSTGQLFKEEPERGIFRTTDGGKTWRHVLNVDTKTGCSDLAMDPQDPNTLVAGMWPVMVYPWKIDSGGPKGGVYITHDGGATWKKQVGHGMPADPDHPIGKVAVAIAQSDPKRIYALVQDTQPTLYRSDDGGGNWTLVSHDHLMVQRDSYYFRFGVSTTDPDRLYFQSPYYTISLDGGKTFVRPPGPDGFASAGGDNHDVWIDPLNSQRIMVANDAGISISLDGSKTFEHIRLPISQVYHVTVDDQIPYNIYGNLQDASSFRGPSNSLGGGGFGGGGGMVPADFKDVGGCESGFATADPADNNIVWSGCYEGRITRIDMRDGQARDVSVWPDVDDGWAPKDVKYRWHWTIPLTISPFDAKHVYVGSQYVHQTKDGGQTWKTISPDLTTNDKSHQGSSGGITRDDLYTFDANIIYSIAESPVKQGVLWVGTNDSQVQLSEDGGAHWTNVSKNITGMAPYGTIWNIEPSKYDAGTAYITVNLEQMGDYNAYAYKTTDFGKTWKMITAGVPKSVNSSAHCIIEDPVRKGMLYLGTDDAIYVSWNDGESWKSLNYNMPNAPVYWIAVQKRFNDLVVSTYGRGDYIMDDITALREIDKAEAAGAPTLFKPRDAYRFRSVTARPMVEPGGKIIGQNPVYGADINFYLPAPDPAATVVITGADGKTIKTLKVRAAAGMNRAIWDLRGENGAMPHMLVPPPGEPWVPNGPGGYHILSGIMIPTTVRGVLMPPGQYTVQVNTGGKTMTAPLTVLADPHTLGTPATIEAGVAFQTRVLGEIADVSKMIESLEWVRSQVATLEMRYGSDPSHKPMLDAARSLADKATLIEGKLIDIHLTNGHEDLNRNPSQLYQKLTALYDKGDADLGPTAASAEVNNYFVQWMQQSQAAYKDFEAKDVAAFNEVMKSHHVMQMIQP